jgi:antitoxin component YwqK of YwqJK toxin-antitoxin module
VDGLWKEHFPSDSTLTILFYDSTGKAVKQALYYNGRLIRESPIGDK